MGPLAVLIDEVDDPAGWATAFGAQAVPGVVDVVPAARTVMIVARDERSLARVRGVVVDVRAAGLASDSDEEVVIRVDYDGSDLAEVASAVGLTPDEVVDLHTDGSYRVEFCGFAPGFGYLSGLPPQLHLPRRRTPRTRVPAGSVAIASQYSAVYPTASPGGWHLLGSTGTELFDVDRERPALLTPGTSVRFVPA